MKNIQNLILVAFMALAMVACKKDKEVFNTTSSNQSIKTSQQNNPTNSARKSCGSKAYTEQKMQDPEFRAFHENATAKFERNLKLRATSRSRSACTSPTVLPVAIHYQGASNPDKTCLVNVAKKQSKF